MLLHSSYHLLLQPCNRTQHGYFLSSSPFSRGGEGMLWLSVQTFILKIYSLFLFWTQRDSACLRALGAEHEEAQKTKLVLLLPSLACWSLGNFSRAASVKLLHPWYSLEMFVYLEGIYRIVTRCLCMTSLNISANVLLCLDNTLLPNSFNVMFPFGLFSNLDKKNNMGDIVSFSMCL